MRILFLFHRNQLVDEQAKNDMLNGQLRQHRDDEEALRHQIITLQNERKLDREDAQNTAQVKQQEFTFALIKLFFSCLTCERKRQSKELNILI